MYGLPNGILSSNAEYVIPLLDTPFGDLRARARYVRIVQPLLSPLVSPASSPPRKDLQNLEQSHELHVSPADASAPPDQDHDLLRSRKDGVAPDERSSSTQSEEQSDNSEQDLPVQPAASSRNDLSAPEEQVTKHSDEFLKLTDLTVVMDAAAPYLSGSLELINDLLGLLPANVKA